VTLEIIASRWMIILNAVAAGRGLRVPLRGPILLDLGLVFEAYR